MAQPRRNKIAPRYPSFEKHVVPYFNEFMNELKHAPEGTDYGSFGLVAAGFDCQNFPRKSAAVSPKCAKTCSVCSAQYVPLSWQENYDSLRYHDKLSDEEAEMSISALLETIEGNLAQVRDLLSSHGDSVLRRWQKRNPQKRARLLQHALPTMRRFRTQDVPHPNWNLKDRPQMKAALTLPYLDLDTLSREANCLLALIHSRATSHPAEWVMFDSSHLKQPFALGAVEISFNPHCVWMLHDDSFGTLVPWDEKQAHAWLMIGFPLARLIFQAQSDLSTFLLKVVRLLLQDKSDAGSTKWDALVAINFRVSDEQQDLSVSRPVPKIFCRPSHLSLERIVEIFNLRCAAAKDDCRLMQTDPAFVQQRTGLIQTSGIWVRSGTHLRQLHMCSVFFDAVGRQENWELLRDEAQYALNAQRQHGANSEQYRETLQVLDWSLRWTFNHFLVRTKGAALESGIFDEHFTFRGNSAPEVNSKNWHKDPLFYCFHRLSHHDSRDKLYPGILLSAIESMIAGGEGEKQNYLNQNIVERLSDLAAMDDVIMALYYDRQTSGPQVTSEEMGASAKQTWSQPHYDNYSYQQYVEDFWIGSLDKLWEAVEDFLSKPTLSGRISVKTLKDFDVAHDALQDVWQAVRQVREDLLNRAKCPSDKIKILMEVASAGVSKEYRAERSSERQSLVECIEAKEAVNKARTTTPKKAVISFMPLEGLQTSWGQKAINEVAPTSPKVKVKTRRASAKPSARNEEENQDDGVPDETPQLRIPVTAASLDIFHKCFVSYGKHTSGNTRFDDFARALSDAGMRPSQSSVGSAVTFRGDRGSMVVHRPHPDPSINPICMRSFGKRLNATFGWTMDTFVLRESKD